MCFHRVSVIVIVLLKDSRGTELLKYINVGDKSTMVAQLPQQVLLLLVLVTGTTMGIGMYASELPKSPKSSHSPGINDPETWGVHSSEEIPSKSIVRLDEASKSGFSIGNIRANALLTTDKDVTWNDKIKENFQTALSAKESKDLIANEFPSLKPFDKIVEIRSTSSTEGFLSQRNGKETWEPSSSVIYLNPLEPPLSLRSRRTSESLLLSSQSLRPSSLSSSSSSSMTSSVSSVSSLNDIPTSTMSSRSFSVLVSLSIARDNPKSTLPTLVSSSGSRIHVLNEKYSKESVRYGREKMRRSEIDVASLEPILARIPNEFHTLETSKKLQTIQLSRRDMSTVEDKKLWHFSGKEDDTRHFNWLTKNPPPVPATTLPATLRFGLPKRYTRDTPEADNCERFKIGDPDKQEFYSPNYPLNYSPNTDCVLILKANKGMLLKLDFRDRFELEMRSAEGECRYDYLEVRDGQYGFSPKIGIYCDKEYPPEIISQSRFLWLNFHSDDTIEYRGFKAVWSMVPRPNTSKILAEQDPCIYHETISADFVLTSELIKDVKKLAENSSIPLDCLWVLEANETMKMQLTFDTFKLEKPNDCSANFLDVFDGKPDEPSRLKKFCGSIAEALNTKSNRLYIRLYLEAKAINSSFAALITAARDKEPNQPCKKNEFDCQDATCIAQSLKCNRRRNCRFMGDEAECESDSDTQDRSRIVIILVIFSLIMFGMCTAFVFNCVRKLKRDHRIIREHIRQSREDRLDEIGRRATPCPLSVSRTDLRDGGSESPVGEEVDSSKELIPPPTLSARDYTKELAIKMTYGTKEINDIHQSNNMSNATQERLQESTEEPDMCDSSCQTRESLFAPIIPDAILASPAFSTFGYNIGHENGISHKGTPTSDRSYRHHRHHPPLKQASERSEESHCNSQISEPISEHSPLDSCPQICPKHNPIPAPPGWSLHDPPYPQILPDTLGCPSLDNSAYRRYQSPKPDQESTIGPSIYQQQQQQQQQHHHHHHHQNPCPPFTRQNTVGSGERYGSYIYGSGRASSNTASNATTATTTTTSNNTTGSNSPHSATPKHTDPRYRAEAVIEVDQKRPFSIESTKSAPDVIATH